MNLKLTHRCTDFVHPDDLGLALETMMLMRDAEVHTSLNPPFAPESADIRVADVNGGWHSFETTTWNHLDDEEVRGVLCTCRRIHDRSDLTRAIELLGSGADVQAVLPVVARLADRSLGGAEVRTAIAWKHDDRIIIVSARPSTSRHQNNRPSTSHCVSPRWRSPTIAHQAQPALGCRPQIGRAHV